MLAIRRIATTFCLALLVGAVTIAPLSVATAQSEATFDVAATDSVEAFLRSAESRIANNDSAGAYADLSDAESSLAGHVYFDYLLGVAALDTGRTSEAIFALRRAIAVEPGFSGARMELARAYYESGNHGRARPLFAALLDENPPPGVRGVLNEYIVAIDARPATPAGRFGPFAEFGMGYDSNANGSTDSNQFLGFILSPDNIKTDSPFAELGFGFNYFAPRSTRVAWYAGARANHRYNPDASFVDSTVASALTGFSWQRGRFFGRAGADGYWAARDGKSNSSYGGVDLLFGARASPQWELTFGFRGGALRHDSSIDTLDVDRWLYTAAANYRFAPLASFGLELIGGDDDADKTGSPHGNTKSGGRLVLTRPVGDASLFASIGSLRSDYDGLFFAGSREDTQITTTVQVEFRDVLTEGLSLIPRVRYYDNDSNVALYDYQRTEVALLLRWTPR